MVFLFRQRLFCIFLSLYSLLTLSKNSRKHIYTLATKPHCLCFTSRAKSGTFQCTPDKTKPSLTNDPSVISSYKTSTQKHTPTDSFYPRTIHDPMKLWSLYRNNPKIDINHP